MTNKGCKTHFPASVIAMNMFLKQNHFDIFWTFT